MEEQLLSNLNYVINIVKNALNLENLIIISYALLVCRITDIFIITNLIIIVFLMDIFMIKKHKY